jgi:hypothetical protein
VVAAPPPTCAPSESALRDKVVEVVDKTVDEVAVRHRIVGIIIDDEVFELLAVDPDNCVDSP